MKKLLLIACLLPLIAIAQRPSFYVDEEDSIYQTSIPKDLGKRLLVPDPDDYNFFYHFKEDLEHEGLFIINNASSYRSMFPLYVFTQDSLKRYKDSAKQDPWQLQWITEHLRDSIPFVDFTKNEIVVYAACPVCLRLFNDETDKGSTHRGGCDYRNTWFVRPKNTGITRLASVNDTASCKPVYGLPSMATSELHKYFEIGQHSSYRYEITSDTLYRKIFARVPSASLPVIDFTHQKLEASIVCAQCISLCGPMNTPCHRNACQYSVRWCVKERDSRLTSHDFNKFLPPDHPRP